ncbi:MAG: acyl-CoA dehydrogenase family protein [Myxococcota bacterium]|nr:acyl-CoA dehydrogenase family protein [Myxococcota bacterium]
MDLRYSDADETFRKDLRAWLAEAVPAHGAPPPRNDWDARREWDSGWQRKLFDAGYAGVQWPKEYGGRGASLTEELVYYEETARAQAPYIGMNFVGIRHGGPTLIAEGTELQKQAHLPRILRGEEIWCQGFSEPQAGSDLAALKTAAVRDGDHYVLNGQKIWTSFAQKADYCEMLVRTDPDAKHRGISWLIMPMDLPGIEIRPLPTLLGETDFSEMFVEDVRVPVENLVGAENDGWRVTNVTLRFERGTAWAADIIELQRMLRDMATLAKHVTHDGASAWDDKALRREIGHLSAEVESLWAMVKLQISELAKTGVPGLGGSAIKLGFTELNQRIYELATQLLGRAGMSRSDVGELPGGLGSGRIVEKYLNTLSLTIAAGSSQIQRNIISERILGMPREPR